jgi:hypothetical protein
MRRYLVVAHRSLDSHELMELIHDRMAEGPSRFHLLVPEDHGHGLLWDEGTVRLEAERALEAARLRMTMEGVPVTGEVGHYSPVLATQDVLARERREDGPGFDEIIVSTLAPSASRWIGMDVPARIRRLSKTPVTHVIAARERV